MEKVLAFLKENPVFYFATEEGDKPRVRPFSFFMEYEGKLYFSMGRHKKVYRQILVFSLCFRKRQKTILKKFYNKRMSDTVTVCLK